jgi:DnaJ-class molecular chaperone
MTTLCHRCGGHGLIQSWDPIDCPTCGGAGTIWPASCDRCGRFGRNGDTCTRLMRVLEEVA